MKTLNFEDSSKRRLIHFPIIHTAADMGTLSESAKQAAIRNFGQDRWERNVQQIDQIWSEIESVVGGLDLHFEKVRVYQDGLPVCGRELEIATELAKAGNRNYQLLLRLRDKGATIMGTESSELLVEEYELVKQVLAANGSQVTSELQARQKELGKSLLEKRDRYVATRIDETLCAGETGILFMGMLHFIEDMLIEKDIQVIYPLGKPIERSRRR